MFFNESELKTELEKVLNYFQNELKQLRTGKADIEAISSVQVEAYGMMNGLNTVGQVIVEDAISVKINVWDKGVIQNVERALRESKLGASVSVDQDSVRLKFNPITEEDRRATVKEIGSMLEECRIKIRQIRQKYMKDLENLQNVSEDLQKKDQENLQKIIVDYTAKAEEIANKKEQEIMKF